jgi:hypothetical protein
MAYEIPKIPNVEGCVYKLWYAGKFVVIKCKTLTRSSTIIRESLRRFLANTPKGRQEKDYFHDFFIHVNENPFNDFTIEVILSSNNPLELLKCEFFELAKAKYDPRCLNHDFDVYIPKFTQVNGKKSWINRGYYLNFMQWKRKQLNPDMIE